MARTKRFFLSGHPHEICFRVKEGLPFPCLELIKVLLESAMARALKGEKVVLCHYVWMANHLHLIVVVKDPRSCERFYEELQKKLTDYVKRLLGVRYLLLWEGRPSVAPILTLESVINRIAYFYANPARANLVRSIDQYPGVTTWREFQGSDHIDATHSKTVPWIRCPMIPRIGSGFVSRKADLQIADELKKNAKSSELLVVKPNYWMRTFNLEDEDLCSIKSSVMSLLSSYEREAGKLRASTRKNVIGAAVLREQRIFKPHMPKKRERKIFVICSDKELRIAFVQHLKTLCDLCNRLFEERRFDEWPPGMFRPPLGVLASAIAL